MRAEVFTGLVECIGRLERRTQTGAGMVVEVRAPLGGEPLAIGESIAVDGVCLTVVREAREGFAADVSVETWSRTTLGKKLLPADVNIERAMRLGGRLGGHLVTGHVDARGALAERRSAGNAQRLRFSVPPELHTTIVGKGSIAIDGVSLTVNASGESWFEVMLVPHTAAATTLGSRRVGDLVNIETDLLGKYVVHVLSGRDNAPSGVNLDLLRRHGFA